MKTSQNLSQISWRWLDWQHKTGKVAMICSSFDSALLTWDLFKQHKVTPACSALLENNLIAEADNLKLYREKLLEILAQLESIKEIKVIILNIWESEAVSLEAVQTIIDYCRAVAESTLPSREEQVLVNSATPSNSSSSQKADYQNSPSEQTLGATPYFILRLLNKDNLNDLPLIDNVYLASNLETAILEAIAMVKSN